MADARRRTIKAVYEDPRTGFGSIAQTLQQAQVRDPSISRGEVKAFLDGLRVNQDWPQRGYNSFVPLEPMSQLQVDLADMKAFGGKPYPFMLVAIDALTKKVAAEPLKDRLASTTAAGMKKVFQALGVPIRVKPIESRGSYRVNEIAWSEKVYRVVSAESGEMGARFGLEGWPEKVVHRDLRKVPENSAPEPRGLEVQSRQRRLQRGPRLPPPF